MSEATMRDDIPEDPTGFRVEESYQGGWRWVRLSDHLVREGFATRDEAIADAEQFPPDPV